MRIHQRTPFHLLSILKQGNRRQLSTRRMCIYTKSNIDNSFMQIKHCIFEAMKLENYIPFSLFCVFANIQFSEFQIRQIIRVADFGENRGHLLTQRGPASKKFNKPYAFVIPLDFVLKNLTFHD